MKAPALLALVASLAAAGATPAPPALRLPGDVVPRRAALDLTLRPSEPGFSGKATYEVELKKPVDLIWVHATGLTIGKATLRVAGEERAARVVPGNEDFTGLALESPAGPGAASLSLSFTGLLEGEDTRGLFRQKEDERWYVFSHFEAISARRAFPCFDEPSFKIPWRLTLHLPSEEMAVSNTAASSETAEEGGMKAVSFAETRPLPSYLVALGVGPFDVVDAGSVGRTPLRILTPKGQSSRARWAMETTAPILALLEDYFGTPYPYGKLDALVVPSTVGFGAMENPGLITYSARAILARPQDEGIDFKRGFASYAAHEMAHQWFGDLVTMAFWDDTWLNESFASWMGDKIVARFKPEWKVEVAQGRNGSMASDTLVTARKIHQPIVTKDDIANAFDGITYGKGQAVLGMFEAWMGEETFRKGVNAYLAAHADGNATAADFLAALARQGHPEVPAAFSSFLDQAGAPLLSASLSCDEGRPARLRFAQKRLVPIGSAPAEAQLWRIPVCVRHERDGGEARACTMVSGAAHELVLGQAPGCPAWVLANDGEVGYYRAAYRGELLKKLVDGARERLSPSEKVGLLGDVRALATAGETSVEDALALVTVFARESERHVVETSAAIVEGVRARALAPSEKAAYARFVSKTFGARARALGLAPRPGEDEDTRLLRGTLVSLVAIDGRDEGLRGEAVALAKKWLADRAAVDPDMVPVVLDIAAEAGDAALFDGFLEAARKEKERRDRVRLLQHLGQFRDPKLVARALSLTLQESFEAKDTRGILWAALSDERTREQAFAFVKERWEKLLARLPKQSLGWLPYLGASFCDEAHRKEVEAFFTPRVKGFEGAPRNLAQTLEGIKVCTAVRAAQAPAIRKFLSVY